MIVVINIVAKCHAKGFFFKPPTAASRNTATPLSVAKCLSDHAEGHRELMWRLQLNTFSIFAGGYRSSIKAFADSGEDR